MTRRDLILTMAAAAPRPLPAAPHEWTIAEAARQLRARRISPVELTRSCLERIERLNPKLNAYITVTAETAMEQARQAETEIRAGKWRGPLHGIPIGLKDLIDTAGVKTTCASAIYADRVPTADAEVVRRLKSAGAVLVGKHNMHEFAYGPNSVHSHFGPVRNPWNPERITGGSSGGTAAAVAAGLCYGGIGSDTGGSIRQPAAFCGIAGLKPTYGLVSTRGVIPLAWSQDNLGPMCRTVEDAALMLQVIAGYDPLDTTSVPAPPAHYARELRAAVKSFRIGLPRAIFFENLDKEVAAAVNAAIEELRKLATAPRDVELPGYQALPIVGAEAYAFHQQYLAKSPELYQPMTRQRLEAGAKITTTAYVAARRELDRLRRAVNEVFSTVDILVTPTTPGPPQTIEEGKADIAPTGGVSPSLRNTQRFNTYGLPAISIPCGFTADGMPIGLMIAGPRFAESRVLALAHAYEQASDWRKRRPPGVS